MNSPGIRTFGLCVVLASLFLAAASGCGPRLAADGETLSPGQASLTEHSGGTAPSTDAPQWIAALYMDGRRAVGLAWLPIPGATGYQVFRSEDGGETYKRLAIAGETRYFDTIPLSDTTLHYTVRAMTSSGAGPLSEARSVWSPHGASPRTEESNLHVKKRSLVTRPTTTLWQVTGGGVRIDDAFDLAYDRNADLLYVSSTKHRHIAVLKGSDGSLVRYLGPDIEGVDIGMPLGLAVDEGGTLFVVNGAENTVLAISPQGKMVRSMPVRQGGSEKPPRLVAVAVLPDSPLFVTDSANGRVMVLDHRGSKIAGFWKGSEPGDEQTGGITLIKATPDGLLALLDEISAEVRIFDSLGTWISSFGERGGSLENFSWLHGFTPLDDGHFLVSGWSNNADIHGLIREFSPTEDPLLRYVASLADETGNTADGFPGEKGGEGLPLYLPTAMDGDGTGLLFVIDAWGARVSALRIDSPSGPESQRGE